MVGVSLKKLAHKTPEPFNADEYAPFHPVKEWLQQEKREQRTRAGALLYVLQFRAHRSELTRYACDGSGGWGHVWSLEEIVGLAG